MKILCPNKEICGSCSWSHIPYEKQLDQKVSDINGSFALKGLELRCSEILPAATTEHYRNRMDFVIDFEGRVGMRQKGKWWKVIDDHTCFLSDKKIESLFHVIRKWTKTSGLSFFDRKAHTGILRYAVIRSTALGETMVTIVTSAPEQEKEQILLALQKLSEIAGPTTLVWSVNTTISDVSFGDELTTISGEGTIEEQIDGVRYKISPNAFFQTNSYTAPLLLQTVKEYCGDLSEKKLLDLYCGTGFFSVALSPLAKETVGVEMVPEAIQDAIVNATLNNADVTFTGAKTEDYDWGIHNADVVILDPPRSGMHDKALADVIRILPKTIVYVSCNPKNFAREMVQLQEHYIVSSLRAIDMFPHTPHVELVAKLERK